ncbi:MAG: bifunctional 5,10-methylenetetrahydrofolate dehydrogenase/5,10-methenyltetrahydrofolate cyclohydrolase [Alphaproteobacteria bacterium]|nr:bifunctional 5,10-methylenetetrahydrofolate dehydrogenase/5,10-methenyltetrahydrofolate cyclohydrolase [Alphaproteobacteria bacterium]
MSEATLLRGGALAEPLRAEIADEAARLKARGIVPHLAVVVASDDPGVASYAQSKEKMAAKLGITLTAVTADPADGQAALEACVTRLSQAPEVHGIILALPVASGLDAEAAIACIDPKKDVDGLTPVNLGLIALGLESAAIAPATPQACIRLAESVAPLAGSRVCVVGRGRAVGRGLIPMLINRDATVTVCHSRTTDLAAAIAPSDTVFVAIGRPHLIGAAHIRPGQVVVDAGISMVDGKMAGDVDGAAIRATALALTPVPGGVGPLTSTLIFANLMRAIALQTGEPLAARSL